MTFHDQLSWSIAAALVLVLTVDFARMVYRNRRWRDIDEAQRRRDLRREWRNR